MARFDTIFSDSEPKRSERHPKRITKWIHYTKLTDSEKQYRNLDDKAEIETLADLIEADGEVLEDLLVRKADADTYEIIAGHKRRQACRLLVEERGKKQYEFLPCYVKEISNVRAEFQLYSSNEQHPETPYEKMHKIERMTYLLENFPEEFPEIDQTGRMVERLAKLYGMKKTTVGEYQAIARNLCDSGMKKFEEGELGKSAAYSLSGLPREEQEEILEKGMVTNTEIVDYKNGKKEKSVAENAGIPLHQQEEPQWRYTAEWFVSEYCRKCPDDCREFVKICREQRANADRAKKIQEFISPHGYHGTNASGFEVTFWSYTKGISFQKNHQTEFISYIQFVNHLEKLYGQWEGEAEKTDMTEEVLKGQLKIVDTDMTIKEEPASVPKSGTRTAEADGLPDMKNAEERELFVKNYKSWTVWCRNELTEETFYRYDLPDGSAIVVKSYPYTNYWNDDEELEGEAYYLLKQGVKHFKNGESSMADIKEHLKKLRVS